MQRDASNLTIIGYVRSGAGDDGVTRRLALAHEKRPLLELLDDARRSKQDQKIRLFEAAAIVLDGPEVARRVGETVVRQQTGTAVRLMLRALGSPVPYGAVSPRHQPSSRPTTNARPSR